MVRTLDEMRRIPNLKINLISLGILDSKGYKYTGEGRVLKISKDALIVLQGQRRSQLYVL